MKRIITILLVAICAIGIKAEDQPKPKVKKENKAFENISFGVGLTGTNIFDNNINWKPIVSNDNNIKDARIGGSFDGVETGLLLFSSINLDANGTWILPLSFEYVWLNAHEVVPISNTIRGDINHTIDIQKLATGIHFNFLTFPFKDVKAYLGLEAKAAFINNQEYQSSYTDITTGKTEKKIKFIPKKSAVRFDGEVKLGIRGELTENFFINSSFGIDCLNLLGSDDSRGELLTPFGRYENEETLVPNYHFVLMIEYQL
jgi:hypothetical protein